MSTRPSALTPCSMKFLASASLRRSAGMATILRPVCFGDFLRGGLERLLAARADGDVDAFLGQRQRDALADAFAAAGDQRGLAFELEVHRDPPEFISVCAPASGRLRPTANSSASAALNAAGSSVGTLWPGARDDQQPGGRHGALQEHAAVDARLVLVADDHQQRHREFLQSGFHLPQRRPLELEIEHGLRVTLRRMLGQHAGEFGVAARVLVLLRLPHRRVGVFRRRRRDAFLGEHLAGLGGERLHRLALLGIGVEPQPQPAATTERQRSGALDADMQRGVGAHRVADHVRLVDLERVHQRQHVVARDVLAVARRLFRHVGGRIAALAVGDAAMRAREIAHLRLPACGSRRHIRARRRPAVPLPASS